MSMTISKNSTGVNVLKDLLKELLMPQEFHVPASFVKRLIGASSMRIARKTAKLFTCLGSSTQLGQSIVIMSQGVAWHSRAGGSGHAFTMIMRC